MAELEVSQIHDVVGQDNFSKGLSYPGRYINYSDSYDELNTRIHLFKVESERTYDFYDVEIRIKNKKIVSTECNCFQFFERSMCKHIAACLLQYKDELFPVDPKEKLFLLSKGILEEFCPDSSNTLPRLKKQLFLTVELQFFNNYYDSGVRLNFKIGEDKLYSLNNKLGSFLKIYEYGNDILVFGKSFSYDPSKYFFSTEDEQIINYLVNYSKRTAYVNFQNLTISISMLYDFLELLKAKTFTIYGYGEIHSILLENPVQMLLSKSNDEYRLSFNNEEIRFLSSDYSLAVKNTTLYRIPLKISKILQEVYSNGLTEIAFVEDDFTLFSQGVLPIVSNSVVADQSIEDKIVFNVKPGVKLYFDLSEDIILCNAKFQYREKELDYFDENIQIIRDKEIEQEVISNLFRYGFQISDSKIFIDDYNVMGDFLETNLIELASMYEVFTSEKIKQTRIFKESNIASSFSIGQDNILRYEFDLGEISNDEIGNVLVSLKSKKRYHRLKSGDFIDLYQNDNLQQLECFIDDLELSGKDLVNGRGEIPKYRAIYLDSIKKEKYPFIKTNNLFDALICRFRSYKDAVIDFSVCDRNILRDYQEVGVKWLYNIYKCGFGGILADEMGLGKSIQLIYFIKQVLKEKEDAKVLIVAPTSLVYNWKNEFDKFGQGISYKVLAEQKKIRKKEFDHLEDINVVITTYGLVRRDRELYFNIYFEVIAIDEAQNIKNANAQMTKVVKELKANTKLALTGTPLENSVLELWSIFDFIMPGYLLNLISFRKKYNVHDVDEGHIKVLDHLNEQIKPFILRRKKKDVIRELPDKLENNIFLDLNLEQKKLYVAELEKTRKELDEILKTDGFQKGNFKILQLLNKLRLLCIEPSLLYENYNGGSTKIDHLVSLVQGIIENGHKILLFTSYKMALELVEKKFVQNNISFYTIVGGLGAKRRMELVDKFNSDDTNVFLITLKSGGTGLNLVSADVVIHLDLWWNPQVENQATDRAHRIGQKNTVEVIKLICKGTIEERILQLQNKKKILSDKLIEGEDRDQNIFSKLTENDIKSLLSFDNEDEY